MTMTEEQMKQPITDVFLKKNFAVYNKKNNVYSTTPDQSPVSVDIFLHFPKCEIVVFDETMDNRFVAETIGQLIAFLNFCGLNDFVSTLKI